MSEIHVAIGRGGGPGAYRVDVRSPADQASARVTFDADALLGQRKALEQAVLLSSAPARQAAPAEMRDAEIRGGQGAGERLVRDVGRTLFGVLFGSSAVAGLYRAAAAADRYRDATAAAERHLAAGPDGEMRIVLRIDDPELAGLPWEAMYDEESSGGYVCRRHQLIRQAAVLGRQAGRHGATTPPAATTPVTATTPAAGNPLPAAGTPSAAGTAPVRVLGVVSSPRGLPPLDVDKEKDALTRALSALIAGGLIELAWAPSATWADLRETVSGGGWHTLHYIGHGDFDPSHDVGMLALTGADGRMHLVDANRFAGLLRQASPAPGLVVLNSCPGAASSVTDLFSGTAAALVRGGVTAVAALQYEITGDASAAFARGCYGALAGGRDAAEAVSSGRVAIAGLSGDTLEWVTPVLYLHSAVPAWCRLGAW